MLRDRLPRLVPMALVVLAVGCAGERDATEKQLAELRAEVSRLRAGQAALMERLGTLELERGAAGKGVVGAAPAAPGSRAIDRDRPDLEVVHVSPSEGDGDADSDAGRPMIRAVGNSTLTSRTAGARAAPRRGASNALVKKSSDADVRPVVNP